MPILNIGNTGGVKLVPGLKQLRVSGGDTYEGSYNKAFEMGFEVEPKFWQAKVGQTEGDISRVGKWTFLGETVNSLVGSILKV